MPTPLSATPVAARRFLLRMLGLDVPFPDVGAALSHLGYIQIDPINICGRMHDLILRNRVAGYREGDLMRHLHGDDGNAAAGEAPGLTVPARLLPEQRVGFEHHHPGTNVLVAFPLDAWPHLLGAMHARSRRTGAWSGRLTPTERALAPRLLEEIRSRGPLSSSDFDDPGRSRRPVWGTSTLVKSTLQKLFFHGRLLIAGRASNRRRYDLPERVLPPSIIALGEAPAAETACWLALLKLRQRRLAVLTAAERATMGDAAQPVTVPDCPVLHCLREDAETLNEIAAAPDSAFLDPSPKLLAPLDPLIYDRRLMARLWRFDYTWEAYTPAAKRVRGHYALPVLAGTELVGHVEPKADRANGRLVVASRSVRRGYATSRALDDLAKWLGLKRG